MMSDQLDAGVWVVWDRDYYVFVSSVHVTELEALRVINEQGYGKVSFVPFGADINEVLT